MLSTYTIRRGGRETIDTLLLVKDNDTWCKPVGNELERLDNWIDNRVQATNTIKFIQVAQSYMQILCVVNVH